jgi:hypothetical protein
MVARVVRDRMMEQNLVPMRTIGCDPRRSEIRSRLTEGSRPGERGSRGRAYAADPRRAGSPVGSASPAHSGLHGGTGVDERGPRTVREGRYAGWARPEPGLGRRPEPPASVGAGAFALAGATTRASASPSSSACVGSVSRDRARLGCRLAGGARPLSPRRRLGAEVTRFASRAKQQQA